MAKSTGNIARVAELLDAGVSPRALRYALIAVHYRAPLNYSDESLAAATAAVDLLDAAVAELGAYRQDGPDDADLGGLLATADTAFGDALDDDLNVSAALAALFDAVREINRRIDARSLAAGDRAAYGAWQALLAGESAPGLPAAAAAPLLTALGALLHLEDYEAFGTLLPAWDQVALPSRQRGELLAELYQRRGYLDSAAEQWIAIVERSGPDARALQALAEIAAARGFHEDAEVFAQEAGRLSANGAAVLK